MRRISFAALLWLAACASNEAAKGQTAAEDEPVAESEDASDEVAEDFDDSNEPSKSRGETSVSVTYAKSAAENWRRGEAEFADENYLAAQKFYSYIRSKFPYSSYAVRAELRIADCLFERERYLEAIDAYSNFQRLHPTSKQLGYAAYQIGVSYYEQIPTDWFMLPPSHEKDQASVRDAARALTNYVERYPKDANIKKGEELLRDVRLRLVAHERAVADFYKVIDKPKAYVGRLEVIRQKYADVALTDTLLLELIEGYVEIEDRAKAQATYQEMAAKFPGSKLLARAKAQLRPELKAG